MAYTKTVRCVLVEKVERVFEDMEGQKKGYWCTVIVEDGSMMGFWCAEGRDRGLGSPHDADGFDPDISMAVTLKGKFWDGKTKWSVV